MASVRERRRVTVDGKVHRRWVADYFDEEGKRHIKTFVTKKGAIEWNGTAPNARRRMLRAVHTMLGSRMFSEFIIYHYGGGGAIDRDLIATAGVWLAKRRAAKPAQPARCRDNHEVKHAH